MNSPGRYLLPAAVLSAIVYFLFKVHEVLLPFVLGATLAYLLSPLIRFFEVHGLRRQPVVVIVCGLLLAALSGGTYLIVSLAGQEASKAAVELPKYVERGQHLETQLEVWINNPGNGPLKSFPFLRQLGRNHALMDHIDEYWRALPGLILEKTPRVASHILPFMELFLLVPFIAFLLLLEGPALIEGLLGLVSARYVEMFLNIVVEIDNSMGNYIRGICLKSLVVGVLSLAGFWMIGLDYSIQLSVVMGLTNVIPLAGPLISGGLAVLVALFQWGSLGGVAQVLLVCVAMRVIDDGVLQVVILKNSVELHPIFLLFSLMAGGALWGFWGLLFGVPLACMVKVLLEVLFEWYRSEYGLRYDDTPGEASHIPLI